MSWATEDGEFRGYVAVIEPDQYAEVFDKPEFPPPDPAEVPELLRAECSCGWLDTDLFPTDEGYGGLGGPDYRAFSHVNQEHGETADENGVKF